MCREDELAHIRAVLVAKDAPKFKSQYKEVSIPH
jgi:hypothetical protein